MELKDFIEKVILDITGAINDAREKANYDMNLSSSNENRTIEFDIAVSAEENSEIKGETGIKVLRFVEAEIEGNSEIKNSTVSRIKFGIHVNKYNKSEQADLDAKNRAFENQDFKTSY